MMHIIMKHHFQSHWHMLLLVTNHKGTTINSKVIIDIKEAFAPGLTYVMRSRVTKKRI